MRITDISILEFKGLKVEGALTVYADSRDDTIRPILGNPEFGIREIFPCGIRNPGKFASGMWSPGFWNPEYNSRNPESH